jgi:mTERF
MLERLLIFLVAFQGVQRAHLWILPVQRSHTLRPNSFSPRFRRPQRLPACRLSPCTSSHRNGDIEERNRYGRNIFTQRRRRHSCDGSFHRLRLGLGDANDHITEVLDNDEEAAEDDTRDDEDHEHDDPIFDEVVLDTETHNEGSVNEATAATTRDLIRLEPTTDNVSYFYLKNELGLSEEAMWRITFEAGSALGMTAATLRRKVDLLRDNLNLSPDDVRMVLERQPTILQLSADKNLAPTILFLVRALDLGKDELRTLVVESPSVLSYRKDNLVSKINFFTRLMGYSISECRELLVAEPKLLRSGVATSLIPTMRFFVRDMEIPLEQLRQIVQRNPRVLLYSLDDNLIPKVIYFLIMTLQMSLVQVQKLLCAYPEFLDYNLDRHTLPIAKYFMKDLEYSPNEMSSILLKFPRLVTYQLARIKHRVGYLRYEIGLGGSQVKRVLYQSPQLTGLAFDTLRDKIAFLHESLQLSPSELRTVVAGMPTLLVLSPRTNLQPKLDYLLASFGGSNELVRQAVVRLPTLLGYSLENRIQPRMDRILAAGLDPSSVTIGIPMREDRFLTWLERRAAKLGKDRYAMTHLDGMTAYGSSSDQLQLQQEQQQQQQPQPQLLLSADISPPAKGVVHWTRERRPLG